MLPALRRLTGVAMSGLEPAVALAGIKGIRDGLKKLGKAAKGSGEVKVIVRERLVEYDNALDNLEKHPEKINSSTELDTLREQIEQTEKMLRTYTAMPGDGWCVRTEKRAMRMWKHETLKEELRDIDRNVQFQLTALAPDLILKYWRGLENLMNEDMRILLGWLRALGVLLVVVAVELTVLYNRTQVIQRTTGNSAETLAAMAENVAMLKPRTLDPVAAVPPWARETADVRKKYVARTSIDENIVAHLTDSKGIPLVLVGAGGFGKTASAHSAVRSLKVRQHFRDGIFKLHGGQGGGDRVSSNLQDLAQKIAMAPTDNPHGIPQLSGVDDDIVAHLTEVGKNKTILVVLDDVWERDLVDKLSLTGFQLLITTRTRDAVAVPAEFVAVGKMKPEEALQMLGMRSGAVGTLPHQADAVRFTEDLVKNAEHNLRNKRGRYLQQRGVLLVRRGGGDS